MKARSFDMELCTANGGHSERCQNPLCRNLIEPENGRRSCSDECRQAASIIKRAVKLLAGLSDERVLEILRGEP
jgi:hypothetical protein